MVICALYFASSKAVSDAYVDTGSFLKNKADSWKRREEKRREEKLR
jgi:hypothetical protein